jgi:hypothetical protein
MHAPDLLLILLLNMDTGIWLQDWVGLQHSWDGDRLIWNWELNNDHYPGMPCVIVTSPVNVPDGDQCDLAAPLQTCLSPD